MNRLVLIFLIFFGAGMTALPAHATTDGTGPTMNIDGHWFSCEFAHSQIPPEDNCKMFDDDGFIVSKGRIDHIKVTDSQQVNCRHQRLGQCFERTREKIIVSQDSVGPVRATKKGFAVTYWGCTQEYLMSKQADYFEISPTGRHCLWTRDKRYFVARFHGMVEVGKK